jgi:glyoxylase-like metal-dependent hydrolase (beta-lactamase superfamily II)
MNLPLEDAACDVIGKAMRGMAKDVATLSRESGVPEQAIADQLAGRYDSPALAQLAGPLFLHGPSLAALAEGTADPDPVSDPSLISFTTTWDDMTVNAYLVFDAGSRQAAVFDTGADASPIIAKVRDLGLTVTGIFITHTHPDHIAALDELRTALGHPAVHANRKESVPGATGFDPGATFPLGSLSIGTRLTCGHARAGTTYVINGGPRSLAIVGDAMFARSMGGGMISYAQALATNRKEILSLPDDTIIAPGHGPLTTVGWEKAANPFFPECK